MDPEQLRRLQAEAWLAEQERQRRESPEGRAAAAERQRRSELRRGNEWAVAESLGNYAGVIPVVGEVLNGASAVYHTGSAIYDGVTGDRDGAINHGTQAAYSALGVIPGISEAMGAVDLVGNTTGLFGRVGYAGHGGDDRDASEIPGGVGDLLGSGAVALANGVFGGDDDNWIAEGDAPTGTRGGEIDAGFLWAPRALGLDNEIGEYFGADVDAPTSGARGTDGQGNWAQAAGDWIHERFVPGMRGIMDRRDDLIGGPPLPLASELIHGGIDRAQEAAGASFDAGNEHIDRGQAVVSSSVASGNATVDEAQATVAATMGAGDRGIDRGQRAVARTLADGQGHVDRAQRRVRAAAGAGNDTIDAAQRALGLGQPANLAIDVAQLGGDVMLRGGEEAIDLAQGAVDVAHAMGSGVVDAGQAAARTVAGGTSAVVDAGQSVATGATQLASGAIDLGQAAAGGIARTAGRALDAGQGVSRAAVHRARQTADTLWEWMTD